jgi:hypothetical protein
MICRTCGTEIADKAIVCYRCGTGTADPVRKAVEIRPRRSPVVPAIVLIVLAMLAYYLGHTYHIFGLELALPDGVAILIDFPAIHA